VEFDHRVLWDRELQRVQSSMDFLEAPMDLTLDFWEATREISTYRERGGKIANLFAMTSKSFWLRAFDRASVPNRARSPGSAVDHGRVVAKNSLSFFLASLDVIRA